MNRSAVINANECSRAGGHNALVINRALDFLLDALAWLSEGVQLFGLPVLAGAVGYLVALGLVTEPVISTQGDAIGIGLIAAAVVSFVAGTWE